MTDREWLASLKPGDRVMLRQRVGIPAVYTVTAVNKVRISCGAASFSARDGAPLPRSDWTYDFIEPADEQVIANAKAELRLTRCRNRLSSIRWKQVPDETVLAVYAMLPADVRQQLEQ